MDTHRTMTAGQLDTAATGSRLPPRLRSQYEIQEASRLIDTHRRWIAHAKTFRLAPPTMEQIDSAIQLSTAKPGLVGIGDGVHIG